VRRLAVAEDVAAAMHFLVSDASSMITGVLLPVDGGNLALNGTKTFVFNLLDGSLAPGTYDLIESANSSVSGAAFNHNLPVGSRQSFAISGSAAGSQPSKVWLTVTGNPATLTWTGATNSTSGLNNWISTIIATFALRANWGHVVTRHASRASLRITRTLSTSN
jgi:hypothetical protein